MDDYKISLKIKIVIFIQISVIISLFYSCSNNQEQKLLFSHEKDTSNIFMIRSTGFNYQNKEIYSLFLPEYNLFNSFIKGNYLIVDGNKVSALSLGEECIESYKKKEYIYGVDVDINKINPCDITAFLFADFSLNINDTIKVFKNHWILLKDKFPDKEILNDTVYVFSRKWNDNITNIVISPNIGILGVYNVYFNPNIKKFLVQERIGKCYLDKLDSNYIVDNKIKKITVRFSKENIDLSMFEEFKNRKRNAEETAKKSYFKDVEIMDDSLMR
jgi:hypothetical protein